MNKADYKKSNSGNLKRIIQNGLDYYTFIPNPLPPENLLNNDLELIRTTSRADRALGELAGIGRNMANPQLLINPFVRREAVLSSRIEGTRANIKDIYALEAREPLDASETETVSNEKDADVQEVANYVRALYYGINRLSSLPISLRLIKEIHKILMKGVRGEKANPGEFRNLQNWIGTTTNIADARFIPPSVAEMLEALDLLEKYIHAPEEYPPLIRMALIHYQFETIHPFVDGNGRMGRLLITLLMIYWQLLPQPLLYLSAYLERNRTQYMNLLRDVSENGNWRDWLIFFLEGVASEAIDATRRAKELEDLQAKWRDLLHEANGTMVTLRVLDTLFEMPYTYPTRLKEQLNIAYPTARKALQTLLDLGIVKRIDNSEIKRDIPYIAEDIFKIIS